LLLACGDDASEPTTSTPDSSARDAAIADAAADSAVPEICENIRERGPTCPEEGVVCPAADLSYGMMCVRKGTLQWQPVVGEGPQPCPALQPPTGTSCPSSQRCTYDNIDMPCSTAAKNDSECDPERSTWQRWTALSCDPPRKATCDATGVWRISFTPDDELPGSYPCGGPIAGIDVRVRAADSGVLQVQGLTGTASANGCQLTFHKRDYWSNTSENATVTSDIVLMVNGDEADGGFVWRVSGFCSNMVAGNVHAKRVTASDSDGGT
jgi:hypothetical protein